MTAWENYWVSLLPCVVAVPVVGDRDVDSSIYLLILRVTSAGVRSDVVDLTTHPVRSFHIFLSSPSVQAPSFILTR